MKPEKLFVWSLVLSLVLRIILSISIYSGDLNNHVGWGDSILTKGFSGAYSREYVGIMQPTYPPLSLYAFTTSTGLYRLIYTLSSNLNKAIPIFPSHLIWALEDQDVLPAFNKVITILADVGIGVLIYMFAKSLFPSKPKLALLASALYLFNPAVWYTSSLWGQIESFPLFFVLLSYWFIYRRRPWLANTFFLASLVSKQSSIIFIPIFTIFFFQQFGFKKLVYGMLLQLALFYLVFIPFFDSPNPFWPIQVYINRLQVGSGSNWITDHAFNPWVWYSHLQKIPDNIPSLWGFTPNLIGTVTFLALSGILLFKFWRRNSYFDLFLISGVVSMVAFLVLTKMHERYLAPALPFLLLASLYKKRLWLIYLIVSFVHLANLYHNWWFPRYDILVDWLTQSTTINLLIVALVLSCILSYFTLIKSTIVNEKKL